jgi:isocitrate dehydrogenase (NAD+)
MRCSPRWRTKTTRTSPSGSPHWAQVSIESAIPLGSSISPASQWAPRKFHGTTCSRRQNAALRAPGTSCARHPSSRSIGLPHQEQLSVDCAAMADLRIIVLEGDETGQELLEQSLRVLDPGVVKVPVELEHYDLSLENRRRTSNEVVTSAAGAVREARFGLKAATITPEGKDDVGSPNRLLREAIDGKVIIRTGRRIPGVTPVAGVHYPIAVVRMAVGDAYGAEEGREQQDGDEIAFRTERISRSICRAVAEYSFRTAARIHGRVYGGPKWTVSPVYEGMLKEEMDEASDRHPEVPYSPMLIDATYAGLISGAADAPLVIPALNRDGDCLSDLVMPMFGSIAGAESVLLAFDDKYEPKAVMAEAPHGTAPALKGKDIANPMAMILAGAAVLHYAGTLGYEGCDTASRAIYESVLEAVATGVRTPDLGGHATTSEFTGEVIARVRTKIDIWASL